MVPFVWEHVNFPGGYNLLFVAPWYHLISWKNMQTTHLSFDPLPICPIRFSLIQLPKSAIFNCSQKKNTTLPDPPKLVLILLVVVVPVIVAVVIQSQSSSQIIISSSIPPFPHQPIQFLCLNLPDHLERWCRPSGNKSPSCCPYTSNLVFPNTEGGWVFYDGFGEEKSRVFFNHHAKKHKLIENLKTSGFCKR